MNHWSFLIPRGPGKANPTCRWLLYALTFAATSALGGLTAWAMPAAPAGVVETGAPSFVVLGPEALGLSTAPTDLHLLTDGRILVVSQNELAFGDGVRWEAFRQAEGQHSIFSSVAVDNDGQIYASSDGSIARVELSEGARWHLSASVKLPTAVTSILNSVAAFPDHWYWYGGNAVFASWRPGQPVVTATHNGVINGIFALGSDIFISDQSAGGLFRLGSDGTTHQIVTGNLLVGESVTCAMPYGSGQLLIGTISEGLFLFDGTTRKPFGQSHGRVWGEGHRITDLCAAGQGFFAGAVDTVGIVFFDEQGFLEVETPVLEGVAGRYRSSDHGGRSPVQRR